MMYPYAGHDLMERLSSSGSTVPVVLITARPDTKLVVKAAAAGAAYLLTKPFEINELIKCIESCETVKNKSC
jgi:FixJ family two-component response regulator